MTARVGWLDCSAGAAGDMILGALVGAGVPLEVVAEAVAALDVPVRVEVVAGVDAGLAVRRAAVTGGEERPPRRTYTEVRRIVRSAPLAADVRDLALDVFARLARAEAKVHGTSPEEVHFHEVGALDALADVVGCAAGFRHLDLAQVVVSPVALGSGRVAVEHGSLPVPVPAVLELFRESGLVAVPGTAPFEQCTPTGAAVLAAVATACGPMPSMVVEAVGVGAGTRHLPDGLNAVRLVVGAPAVPADAPAVDDDAVLLSTNVDDLDPRLWPAVLERLLDAGASDAWLTPILMKKGRPAHTLSVLCPVDVEDAARALVFRETSAIGLRRQRVGKVALQRTERLVQVEGGAVRVKLAWLDGELVNVQPEYDDVRAAADASRRPLKAVLADAVAAAGPAGTRDAAG